MTEERLRSSRRSFLRGQFLSPAAQQEKNALAEKERNRKLAEAPAQYMEYSRKAMASDFVIFTNAGEYENAFDAAVDALDEVSRLEKILSYFIPESEVSCLNEDGPYYPVTLSSEVYQLLRFCRELFEATDGAFDVTTAPLSEVWGFMRRQGRLPTEEERLEAMAKVGTDFIIFDDAETSVQLGREGMKVAFGSIGKGYALDCAAQILELRGLDNYLFHGGLSSLIAHGARRGREDWLVGLHHPLKPTERLMEIPLKDRALGTSGSATQFFWANGHRYGHVLDPRTGFPGMDVLSATVLAPTATEADALATAFYVMGPEQAKAFCEKRPDLGAIFVLPDSGANVKIVQFGNI
ncbi:MAG: FAD:protein FMN transferase [Planctomycetaceae bacterium]|nr:FAD:protein FMN transferase [Planctomycetaceae bacterium]MBQ2821344.1 FAD:protein FMN transferase [Thermoguttaceae bacterium]